MVADPLEVPVLAVDVQTLMLLIGIVLGAACSLVWHPDRWLAHRDTESIAHASRPERPT